MIKTFLDWYYGNLIEAANFYFNHSAACEVVFVVSMIAMVTIIAVAFVYYKKVFSDSNTNS